MNNPEAFDEAVCDLAHEAGAKYLLFAIPGVWELVSEHFNNEALDRLSREGEQEDACRRCGEPTYRGLQRQPAVRGVRRALRVVLRRRRAGGRG